MSLWSQFPNNPILCSFLISNFFGKVLFHSITMLINIVAKLLWQLVIHQYRATHWTTLYLLQMELMSSRLTIVLNVPAILQRKCSWKFNLSWLMRSGESGLTSLSHNADYSANQVDWIHRAPRCNAQAVTIFILAIPQLLAATERPVHMLVILLMEPSSHPLSQTILVPQVLQVKQNMLNVHSYYLAL